MQALENRLRDVRQNFDVREWIPVWGIGQVLYNTYNNKPGVTGTDCSSLRLVNAIYQIAAPLYGSVFAYQAITQAAELINKL